MAFTATKREWNELYAFLRLLSEGYVYEGTSGVKRNDEKKYTIAMIEREEHNGARRYYIEGEHIRVQGNDPIDRFSRNETTGIADNILRAIKSSDENEVESPDKVEAFLDKIKIYNLKTKTDDRTDIKIAFWNPEAELIGFTINSRLGNMTPLLDGGRTANLKFEQVGVKFASPMVSKINALESPNEVADRMLLIERMGGQLKYTDGADKVFRSNLLMIDLHFPRLLAEMVRTMHLDGITRINELTEAMKRMNPLKIKEELIVKHGFYEYKIKQFLNALARGMRPAKIFNGNHSAIEGILMIDGKGEVLCYQSRNNPIWEDFLFHNTRLEKGPVSKDKYGYLEKENGTLYFKLNAKIGLTKR